MIKALIHKYQRSHYYNSEFALITSMCTFQENLQTFKSAVPNIPDVFPTVVGSSIWNLINKRRCCLLKEDLMPSFSRRGHAVPRKLEWTLPYTPAGFHEALICTSAPPSSLWPWNQSQHSDVSISKMHQEDRGERTGRGTQGGCADISFYISLWQRRSTQLDHRGRGALQATNLLVTRSVFLWD